jgi:hypothetical protein
MYRDQEQREFARSLRNRPTEAEKRLWHFLRAEKLCGHKFRRQAAIGPYIVDFIRFEMKLIVELDGPQHSEPNVTEFDQRRKPPPRHSPKWGGRQTKMKSGEGGRRTKLKGGKGGEEQRLSWTSGALTRATRRSGYPGTPGY